MFRRTLPILIFLLPPLLVAFLWLRSCWIEDDLQCLRQTTDLDISDDAGKFGIDNDFFTLASHAGLLALVRFQDCDDAFPVRPATPPTYQWCWRNNPEQPTLGELGYPVSGAEPENPLFEPEEWFQVETEMGNRPHFWNHLGFVYDSGHWFAGRMWSIRIWYCPWWSVALLAAVPALVYCARRLYRHRHPPAPGLCPKCAYDLRAHQPGQRCPECGTLIPIPR